MDSLAVATDYEILKMIESDNTVSIRKFGDHHQIQVVMGRRVVRRRIELTELDLYGIGWVPASRVRLWNGMWAESIVEQYTRLANEIRKQYYADMWEIIQPHLSIPQSLVGIVRGYLW
jgi:hypothetical protein